MYRVGKGEPEIKKYHLVENNVVILLLSKTLHETPFSIFNIKILSAAIGCNTR